MSLISLTESDIGKSIMSALKEIGGSSGASLEDIKQYLTTKEGKVPDIEGIKTWLNRAVDKGILSVSDGKYKLNDTKEYAQQAGQAIMSKVTSSKDKMKHCTKETAKKEEKNEKTAHALCDEKCKSKDAKECAQKAGQTIMSKVCSKDKMKESAEKAAEQNEKEEKNEKRPFSDDEEKK